MAKTQSAKLLEYSGRQVRRAIYLVVGLFVLFLIVMSVIWVVPKVWHWALG